jgi:hypothetical protein
MRCVYSRNFSLRVLTGYEIYRNLIAQMTTVEFLPLPFTPLMPRVGFDLRPFLYPASFPYQFNKIDAIAKRLPDRYNDAAGSHEDPGVD